MSEHNNNNVSQGDEGLRSELGAMLEQTTSAACEIAASTEQTARNMQTIKQEVAAFNKEIMERSIESQEITEDIEQHLYPGIDKAAKVIKQQSEKAEELQDNYTQVEESSQAMLQAMTFIDQTVQHMKFVTLQLKIAAAKLGEEGKPSTVIANEMDKLTERAEESSLDIQTTIMKSLKTVNKLAVANKDFTTILSGVANAVNDIKGKLDESLIGITAMTTTIQGAQVRIDSINNAITESVNAVEQNATAVLQIKDGTKEISEAFFKQ